MISVESEISRMRREQDGGKSMQNDRLCESPYLREKTHFELAPEERDYEEVGDCVFADYI
jgi:hypothetical protein